MQDFLSEAKAVQVFLPKAGEKLEHFSIQEQRTWNHKDHPQENWLNWIWNRYRANKPELSVMVFSQTRTEQEASCNVHQSLADEHWQRAVREPGQRNSSNNTAKNISQSTCDGGWLNSAGENVLTVGGCYKHHALFPFWLTSGNNNSSERRQDRN